MADFDKGFVKDIGIIALIFLAALLISQPWGSFPLNDDWSYSRILKNWLDGGPLRISGWTAVTLLAQIVWGRLFCEMFGFSFDILRLSTIVLALAGLIVLYVILRELKSGRQAALFGVLVMAFNPVYFLLTPSFMTEIPFQTATLLALWAGLRALRTNRYRDLLLLSLFSVMATLIRQTGLIIPIAFLCVHVCSRGSLRRPYWRGALPFVLTAACLILYMAWLGHHGASGHGFPTLMRNSVTFWAGSARLILAIISRNIMAFALYLALFAAPWLIYTMPAPKSRRTSAGLLLVALLLTAILWSMERLMPLPGNLIHDFGLGPILLRDVAISKAPHHPALGLILRLPLTLLAVTGLILGMLLVWRQKNAIRDNPVRLWMIGIGIFYALLFVVTSYFFDRSMLIMLPLLLIMLPATASTPTGRRSGIFILSLFAVFSVLGTHDYFAWNRARWQALDTLTRVEGIAAAEIDGGFEFNGWHKPGKPVQPQKGKSWWWVQDDRYLITMGVRSGYAVYRTFPFRRWLPPGEGAIYVLKRHEESGESGESTR